MSASIRRWRRTFDFYLLSQHAKDLFADRVKGDDRHRFLANIYSFHVAPGGAQGGNDRRALEVFYGQRPFDTVNVPKDGKNILSGYRKKLLTEHGASLQYEQADSGIVLCTLFPAGSENYRRIEDGIVLCVISDTTVLTGDVVPAKHWRALMAYMQYTCLEGEPTVVDKLIIWWLLATRPLIVDSKVQPRWFMKHVGWAGFFLFAVGLSGWALDILKHFFGWL